MSSKTSNQTQQAALEALLPFLQETWAGPPLGAAETATARAASAMIARENIFMGEDRESESAEGGEGR